MVLSEDLLDMYVCVGVWVCVYIMSCISHHLNIKHFPILLESVFSTIVFEQSGEALK